MSEKNEIIENRTLVISNFRNLGPFCQGPGKENNGDKEFLKINRSLDRESLGGLILLIGVNNSGKSNVLDALEKYKTQSFSDDDYTDFSIAGRVKPKISMNLANGKYIDEMPTKQTRYYGGWLMTILGFLLEKENYELYKTFTKNPTASYGQYITYAISETNKLRNVGNPIDFIKMVLRRKDVVTKNIVVENKGTIGDIIYPGTKETINCSVTYDWNGLSIATPLIIVSEGTIVDDSIFININEHRNIEEKSLVDQIGPDQRENLKNMLVDTKAHYLDPKIVKNFVVSKYQDRYNYTINDNVLRYTRETISQEDLSCKPSELNNFMKKVLVAINIDTEVINNSYQGAKTLRHKTEKVINKSLEKISDELNDLLNINEKKYSLNIRLETESIELYITYGDDIPLNINRQSQGFRWLFELYFNMIKAKKFNPGDIILIDEFGDTLGFSTVKELSKKLRDFGRKKGITFILATQNPMAVDVTHLDEVRMIIPQDDGSAKIINEFDHFGISGEHDVIMPVINGLMVSRNYMRTENRRTVFVEGITDYFYLNAFAEKMRDEGTEVDVDFIPINGLGSRDDSAKALIEQICSIERNPILLVDSDKKGNEVSKAATSRKITVASIGEIFDGKKKEIEDLFTENDLAKWYLAKPKDEREKKKLFDIAACFSQKFDTIYGEIEKETKENFKTLIEYVIGI